MANNHEKLAAFLHDASNWSWEEFVRAELDQSYTTNQAIIFALLRACYMQNLDAIKMSINRLDGKLKTPVKIEMPKVYYLFPFARLEKPDAPASTPPPALSPAADDHAAPDVITGELLPPPPAPGPAPEPDVELPSLSIRETLSKMSDYPRDLPEQIIKLAEMVEMWVRGNGPKPPEIPRVKSVVAASLLIMGMKRNMAALTEIFDQIDGKLVETIQVLGDDLYITSYATEAPPDAVINKDGVLQVEATASQQMWADKLGGGKK